MAEMAGRGATEGSTDRFDAFRVYFLASIARLRSLAKRDVERKGGKE